MLKKESKTTPSKAIVYCIDENFLPDAAVSILSFCKTNPGKHSIYIMCARSVDISSIKEMCEKLEQKCIKVAVNPKKVSHIPTHGDYNYTVYYRLLIPELIDKSVKKILFLDGDTMVQESLDELWNTDLRDYYFAAAKEHYQKREHVQKFNLPKGRYFNAGVLLMNIDKIRKEKLFPTTISLLTKNPKRYPMQDQDVLNEQFNSKTKIISRKYNFVYYHNLFDIKRLKKAKIIHFAAIIKPKFNYSVHPLRKKFREYLNQTPYAGLYKRQTIKEWVLYLSNHINSVVTMLGIQKVFTPLKSLFLKKLR